MVISKETILHTVDVRYRSGKYGPYYHIDMVDGEGNHVVTYVDEGNENYYKWARICNTPDKGYVITDCFHKTKYRKPQYTDEGSAIINADSDVKILLECDIDDMRQAVKEMLDDMIFE